tara:strand:+ start:277 stop:816 length:540 start_codon:yes stop_codon:yes gene_type:complete
LKKLFKKKYDKIGILGGTFDPPHIGHLHISKIALKKLKLNKVIWIITKQNQLKKKPYLNIKLRIKLSKNILKKQKKISVKYSNNLINSKNTYDLLRYLKKNSTDKKLFFLMGADNLINFHKWRKWKKIPDLAKIVVFARTKYSTRAFKSIAAKKLRKKDWIYIKDKKINISSSLIRKFW